MVNEWSSSGQLVVSRWSISGSIRGPSPVSSSWYLWSFRIFQVRFRGREQGEKRFPRPTGLNTNPLWQNPPWKVHFRHQFYFFLENWCFWFENSQIQPAWIWLQNANWASATAFWSTKRYEEFKNSHEIAENRANPQNFDGFQIFKFSKFSKS